MRNKLFNLVRDDRGTSIIELALLAPIFATMVIGMSEISLAYSQKLQLEQAAQRSIERAMQGMQGDESTDIFEGLKAEAAAAAGVEENDVEVRWWLECNGVSQNTSAATMAADYNKVCTGTNPVYSRHLSVSIEKVYTPTFKIKWLGSNTDGSFTLVGESGLRVQ